MKGRYTNWQKIPEELQRRLRAALKTAVPADRIRVYDANAWSKGGAWNDTKDHRTEEEYRQAKNPWRARHVVDGFWIYIADPSIESKKAKAAESIKEINPTDSDWHDDYADYFGPEEF